MALEDLLSKMKGQEVVIITKDGYHYGTLRDYDGKMFYLGQYYFSEKLIDKWAYGSASFFNEGGLVPADKVVSISKMPSHVEGSAKDSIERVQRILELRDFYKKYKEKYKAKSKEQEKSDPLHLLTYN